MDVGNLSPSLSQDLINELTLTFLETYLFENPIRNFKNILNNELIYTF